MRALSISKSQILLAWQAPDDNGGDQLVAYSIYRRRHGYSDLTLLTSTASANIFTYDDSSVVAGQAYDYILTSNNTLYGESQHSLPLLNIVAINVPSGLTAPSLVRATRTSLFMSWNAASDDGGEPGALSYILEIKDTTEGGLASSREIYRG